ncbi:inositol-trisphosphate 3-kinase-like protein isoform X2 [Dermatophagoides pteronyssinus]|uniref:Kinase n=2 Tax=Dermatophagoides pteronyssinus TaxID=6956 RepID=A0A6P6YEL2_DERPT|nr:inositol-trisphosphate 3-kinase homolog isoform X2 [Dermatophagoides pteronyssinus]KAH9413687.1 hypothetical protein DERP_009391 [Dermatophagoides pteronyssinus]
MIKLTEFPPVTYSSSFVSYIIQNTNNDNDRCDDNVITNGHNHLHHLNLNHHHHKRSNHSIRLRWQQLARDAFQYSLQEQQRKKQQQQQQQQLQQQKQNNNQLQMSNNFDIIDNHHHQPNKFDILQQNLIDLIAFNSTGLNPDLFDHQWIQLSGHEDSFALAGPGTIWKKHSPDSTEIDVYEALSVEPIAEMIPKFYRNVQYKGDNFIEIEDLLYPFKDASIMDIKMGTRTFLESEVNNSKARSDLYEKMLRLDPSQLTAEEHETKSVTKLRYMMFRENLSSSSNLGFRIEGYKVGNNVKHNKNLHTIKTESDVQTILESFFQSKKSVCREILVRLRLLRKYFESSPFFRRHEIIGSSLLIIYTADRAGVWMIDFAKTSRIPEHCQINHRDSWQPGNHEDGYLFGLDNLIHILTKVLDHSKNHQSQSC